MQGKGVYQGAMLIHTPLQPREVDKATVKAIARNFATTKKGWLSDYHFHNETTLPEDVKAMIGGSQGPTQQ